MLFVLSMPLGYFVPQLAKFLNHFIFYALATVIFLGFLRMDYKVMRGELKNLRTLVLLVCSGLVLRSCVILLLLKLLPQSWLHIDAWLIVIPMIFASPTGAFAPTLAAMAHGNFERTLANMVITTFLAPLTLPLMLYLIAGHIIELDYINMTMVLASLIIFPATLALVVRKAAPRVRAKITPCAPSISTLSLLCVITGAMSGLKETIEAHPEVLLEGVCVNLLLFAGAFLFGWYGPGSRKAEDRITRSVIFTWMNNGLAIALAQKFFAEAMPLAVVFCVLSEIPWNGYTLFLRPWIRWRAAGYLERLKT